MSTELEKFKGFKAELAIAETFEDLKLIESKAAAAAEFGRRNKVGLDEQNEWGKFRVEIEAKKGRWLNENYPKGGDRKSKLPEGTLINANITKKESVNARLIEKEPVLREQVIEDIIDNNGVVTPSLVSSGLKKIKKIKQRIADAEKGKAITPNVDLRLGDFNLVLADIQSGSVDCIITDPPYPIEFIDCWSQLSAFAKRVLRPNGYCIAYSGQYNLPEVIKRMSEHLDYYWTFALIHHGATQIVSGANIMCSWKPILIFQNGKKKNTNTIRDLINDSGHLKDSHDWQQSISSAEYLVTMFTKPDDLIVDPFAGSGSFVIACKNLGRNIISAEIDEETFNIAKNKISEYDNK